MFRKRTNLFYKIKCRKPTRRLPQKWPKSRKGSLISYALHKRSNRRTAYETTLVFIYHVKLAHVIDPSRVKKQKKKQTRIFICSRTFCVTRSFVSIPTSLRITEINGHDILCKNETHVQWDSAKMHNLISIATYWQYKYQ